MGAQIIWKQVPQIEGERMEMETNDPEVEQARTEDLPPQSRSCYLDGAGSVT